MKKQAFISFLCFLNLYIVEAQVPLNRDSLLQLLPYVRQDSTGVDLYINIGQQYEFNEPEVAKKYYQMARDLSNKINYPKGIIKYISNYTYVLNTQGYFDSALQLNLKGIELSREIKDSLSLAKSLFNTGNSYRFKTEFQTAFPYYMEGMAIFENLGFGYYVVQALDILQVINQDLKKYNEAVRIGEEALGKAKLLNNPQIYANVMLNLAVSYINLNQLQKALDLLNETIRMAKQINNKLIECNAILNLADCYLKLDNYEVLKSLYEQALSLSHELSDVESEIVALRGLSFVYCSKNNFDLAKHYAAMSIEKAEKYNFSLQLIKSYTQLSNIYYALHDMNQGEFYSRQALQLNDSLLNDNIRKSIIEMEKKYESEKKDTLLKLQKAEITKRKGFNYAISGLTITILIIFLLVYRNFKQKQKLQGQHILQLEAEKQLSATEAVLKGEEQERTRLAKDLHDGLGGMLSGIKYSLNTMKENLIMTPDNAQAFERSLDMLDSSIQEMRRVAHNLMPETLLNFGLGTALRDFCSNINESGVLKINYQSFGFPSENLAESVSVSIYRIIQELVSNIVKHANAGSAIVQLTFSGNMLSIEVEDDGKGFDFSKIEFKNGIGWRNIRSRLEYLNGKFEVKSLPGKGTSVRIEILIK